MFKSPNSKTIGTAAVAVGAGVVGAKVSDGIVALMPDSTAKYKKLAVAAVALLGAASVEAKTTAGTAVQASLVGMAIKQGADFVTDQLTANVAPKDNSSKLNQFINAVVGHPTTGAVQTPPVVDSTALARLGNPINWAPVYQPEETAFTGV